METQFPPKLAAALCKVSAEVKQLGKSERNKFANYDFVSVDKFYAEIGALMAQNGIHCIPDCIDSEVTENPKSGKPLLRERWAFTLIHESGEQAGPFHRTVTVPAEGAQAHGSSESYAQKQFLRGNFRVPTGDKDDADYQKAEPHSETHRAPPPKQTPHPLPEDMLDWGDVLSSKDAQGFDYEVGVYSAGDSRTIFSALQAALNMTTTIGELERWVNENEDEIWKLNSPARHHLRERFDALKAKLEPEEEVA